MTQADLDVLHAFVGDRLSPEAFPRLESLLRTSPLARRTLRGFTLVEEGLGDIAEERFFDALKPESRRPQPVAPASQPDSRRRWPGPLSLPSLGRIGSRRLALTALLVAGIAVALLLGQQLRWAGGPAGFPAGAVCQIAALSDVVWSSEAAPWHEADGLQAGDTLALDSGLIELSFACGATVVLEGPATFAAADGSRGVLSLGRLAASLENPTGPFAIETPSALVTDRGTQFGVEVDAAGTTEVRVFAGLVDLAPLATLGTAAPLRLAAGNAGAVDPAGSVSTIDAPAPKRFVLTVPRPKKTPPRPLPFRWDAAAAETIYADAFIGAGPLAGSQPAGQASGDAWMAPGNGWQRDPDAGALKVTTTGAAFLPFVPEQGRLYRFSVTMRIVSGGIGWGAIGFASAANTRLATLDHAWMLQRQQTTVMPNAAYAGPQTAGELPAGDRLTGEQVRTVVLDTSGNRWRAYFLAGDTLTGECTLDPPAEPITHVAISVFPNTVAFFHDFSLQVQPAAP